MSENYLAWLVFSFVILYLLSTVFIFIECFNVHFFHKSNQFIESSYSLIITLFGITFGLVGFFLKKAYDEFEVLEGLSKNLVIEIKNNLLNLLSDELEQGFSLEITNTLLANSKFAKDRDRFESLNKFSTDVKYQINIIETKKDDYPLLTEKSARTSLLFILDGLGWEDRDKGIANVLGKMLNVINLYKSHLSDVKNSSIDIEKIEEVNRSIKDLRENGVLNLEGFNQKNPNSWKQNTFGAFKIWIKQEINSEFEGSIETFVKNLLF